MIVFLILFEHRSRLGLGARHLDDIERHMYLRNWMDGVDVLCLAFTLSRIIPTWAIEEAAGRLQEKYAILQARIVEQEDSKSHPHYLDKDFEYVVPKNSTRPEIVSESFESEASGPTTTQVIEHEINPKIESSEIPWRIRVVQFQKEKKSILVRTCTFSAYSHLCAR
jgi:hypothetical protein